MKSRNGHSSNAAGSVFPAAIWVCAGRYGEDLQNVEVC